MRKLSFEEVKRKCLSLEELEKLPRNPIYVIAHNIRSLFNVGSIFRTSDALRVKKIFLTGFTGHPPRDEIEKVALGSTKTVPWVYRRNVIEVINLLKKENVNIVALEHTDCSIDFQEFEYKFPSAIMLGNEYDGLPDYVIRMLECAVEIPMYGTKQSLNVATAFGIVGYELIRQLKKGVK